MTVLNTILTIVFIILSIVITVIILMQEGKSQVLARSPEQQILTGAKIRDVPWKECL